MRSLPARLAVVGAGVIGSEYACTFATLGVEVHLIDGRPSLLPFLDGEIAGVLREAMVAGGVTFHFNELVKRCDVSGGDVALDLSDGTTLHCDNVLVCSGRSSNTADLNLAAAGVSPGRRGVIVVDEHFRTAVGHIYAAGDVIGSPALASSGMEQARVAMCHAFGATGKAGTSPFQPSGIYTIPEVGTVGETEESLRAAGVEYTVGRARYDRTPRGRLTGDEKGLIKLLFGRNECIGSLVFTSSAKRRPSWCTLDWRRCSPAPAPSSSIAPASTIRPSGISTNWPPTTCCCNGHHSPVGSIADDGGTVPVSECLRVGRGIAENAIKWSVLQRGSAADRREECAGLRSASPGSVGFPGLRPGGDVRPSSQRSSRGSPMHARARSYALAVLTIALAAATLVRAGARLEGHISRAVFRPQDRRRLRPAELHEVHRVREEARRRVGPHDAAEHRQDRRRPRSAHGDHHGAGELQEPQALPGHLPAALTRRRPDRRSGARAGEGRQSRRLD